MKTSKKLKFNKLNQWISFLNENQHDPEFNKNFESFLLWKFSSDGIWPTNKERLFSSIKNKLNSINKNYFDYTYNKMLDKHKKFKNNNWLSISNRLLSRHSDAIFVHERYIELKNFTNISLEKQLTLEIDSDLGTGKSQWFYNNYIQHADNSTNILVITARRALSKLAAQRYQIIDYEDAKRNKITKQSQGFKLSICVNSLLTLVDSNVRVDVIFIDEIELLIQHLTGDAVDNDIREELLLHVYEIIGNAKHVICAQHLLTDISLHFLARAGRSNIYKVINTYQPWKGIDTIFFNRKSELITHLLNKVQANIPVLCPCNSIKTASYLYHYLSKQHKDKKILFLTADNIHQSEQARFLNNPNAVLDEYDVGIFSPVIGIGISLSTKKFIEVIGFCSSGEVGSPINFLQMLFRARNVKRISLFIDKPYFFLPETHEECIAAILAQFDLIADFLGETQSGDMQANFTLNEISKIALQVTSFDNQLKNHSCEVLYNAFTRNMGCSVKLISSHAKLKTDAQLKNNVLSEGRKLKMNIYRDEVMNARKLSKPDFARLNKSRIVCDNDYWAVRRYRIEYELVIDLTTIKELDELFAFWDFGRVLAPINNFELAYQNHDTPTTINASFLKWYIYHNMLKEIKVEFDGKFKYDSDFIIDYNQLMESKLRSLLVEYWPLLRDSSMVGITKNVDKRDLGHIIRSLGIKLKTLRPLKKKLVNGKMKSLKDRAYRVDADKMKIFIEVIERRYHSARNI